MSKKQLNIKQNVMEQITENKISMKPKSFFILGSILTFVGLISSFISSVFLISLINFLLKEHGPMGDYRLALMLESFPWWFPLLAIIGLLSGVWFLLKYDFSYKTNYVYIIIGFILAVVIAGWAINSTGLDNLWLNQGPMRKVMRQYMQENGYQMNSNNSPQRGHRGNFNEFR